MVTALVLLFAVVGIKVLTSHFINQLQEQIALTEYEKKQCLSRLKMMQAQKKVAGENKAGLAAKKKKLDKRKKRLETELKQFQEDDSRRRRKSEELKGEPIHLTRA